MGLQVKFWGTRGIISSPSQDTKIYGGNTTCIEIVGSEPIILVDTGFGCSLLGENLMSQILKDKKHLSIHIFYTHFHWDHIQGLPFFHPIYFPSSQLHFYSPGPQSYLENSLDVLFDGSYSPFEGIRSMPSKIFFHEIKNPISMGELVVSFCQVEHGRHEQAQKTTTWAYRFNSPRESITIAPDHFAEAGPHRDRFVQFASGSDILVHDAQFFTEEERLESGDHATTERAVESGVKAKAKQIILTHHDPERKDKDIDAEADRLRKKFKNASLQFAKEGFTY